MFRDLNFVPLLILAFTKTGYSIALHPTTLSRLPASRTFQLDAIKSPAPTEKAVLPDHELLVRSTDTTLCGYWDANIDYPVACSSGYICATANVGYAAGCCNPYYLDSCLLPQTCIPYGESCTGACSAENMLWTSCGLLAPYCQTLIIELDVLYTEVNCGTVAGTYDIYSYAYSASVTHSVVATYAAPAPTGAAATATAAAEVTGGGNTIIYYGSNDCGNGSNCGSGNSNGGSGNTVKSSGARGHSSRPLSYFDYLYVFCILALAW